MIEIRNGKISDAIKVSQLMEHEGFEIFRKYLNSKLQEIRYQDIMGIKDEETLNVQKGQTVAFEDVVQYFKEQDGMAKQPMKDPKTGENEVMNKKK